MKLRYQIIVTGRVQRVSFRAHTVKKAIRLGLSGSATNLPDGSVEVIAQGEQESLEVLLEWLHKGPILACVDAVKWEQIETDSSAEPGFTRR